MQFTGRSRQGQRQSKPVRIAEIVKATNADATQSLAERAQAHTGRRHGQKSDNPERNCQNKEYDDGEANGSRLIHAEQCETQYREELVRAHISDMMME